MGCQPCECDIGGAYDNNCDIITGQCKCRPNVIGRQCNDVPDGFFMGGLDYLVFEGELATGSQQPVGLDGAPIYGICGTPIHHYGSLY